MPGSEVGGQDRLGGDEEGAHHVGDGLHRVVLLYRHRLLLLRRPEQLCEVIRALIGSLKYVNALRFPEDVYSKIGIILDAM